MPKRRRQAKSSSEPSNSGDDAWNQDAERVFNSGDVSEESDASYVQKSRRTKSRVNKVKKKAKHSSDGDLNPVVHQSDSPSSGDSKHPKSIHVIGFPGPIRTALLQWYANVHDTRGMPWRKPYDPSQGPEERSQRAYEVWVSEIMLQQTQVSTVIPYYNRWMEKFPTIHDLADATIDEVNSLWKGLGYYSRASRLLAGAQKVVKQYGGRLPDNAKDMEANIPGIGRYSAGAICSIAYGERVPVLDGNVHRLLSRFLAIYAPPKAKATLDMLWAAASVMVQVEDEHVDGNSFPHNDRKDNVPSSSKAQFPQYAGDINQALIELGSTVCKVRDPNCESCPLRTSCAAFQNVSESSKEIVDIEDMCNLCGPLADRSVVTSYPMRVERKKAREELDVVNVVEWRNPPDDSNLRRRQFLLIKRPESGLLAGLYEFPTLANLSDKTVQRPKIAYDMLSSMFQMPLAPFQEGSSTGESAGRGNTGDQAHITNITPVGDVIHIFSHVRKTYRVQWIVIQGGSSPPSLKTEPDRVKDTKPKKGKRGLQGAVNVNKTPFVDGLWVPLEEVADANMGIGLVKVWNLAKALWEKAGTNR